MYQVFIYCSGKSGSSTLLNTFKMNYYQCTKLHTNIKFEWQFKKSIFDMIDSSCEKFDKIYIIDSYRTPIERKISSFFMIKYFLGFRES